MKKILKYFTFASCMAMILAGCDDIVTYNDGYDDGTKPNGVPVIEKITTLVDEETAISKGSFNDLVVIHGQNLAGLTSVEFNDRQVDLEEVYAVNSRILLRIPASVPDQIDNKLKLATTKGETSTDFTILFPALVIKGIAHEFAKAGEVTYIEGENLKLYDFTPENGELKINGNNVAIMAAEEGKVTFVVPENVPDDATLSLSSSRFRAVTGKEQVSVIFRDTGFRLIDIGSGYLLYPGINNNNTHAAATDGGNPGDPDPLMPGTWFSRLNRLSENNKWNEVVIGGAFDLPANNEIAAGILAGNLDDYDFKYEILVKPDSQITAPEHLIVIVLANRGSNEWKPAGSGIPFHTDGKWKTITMPMSSYAGNVEFKEVNNQIRFAYVNVGQGVELDYCFTNFRITKKTNITVSGQ